MDMPYIFDIDGKLSLNSSISLCSYEMRIANLSFINMSNHDFSFTKIYSFPSEKHVDKSENQISKSKVWTV
jgi:hypothetical protein